MSTDLTDLGLTADIHERGLHLMSDCTDAATEELFAKWRNRGGETPWWVDMDSDGWEMVMKLYQLPSNDVVRIRDIQDDVLGFNHALDQVLRCLRCKASQQVNGIYQDCALLGINEDGHRHAIGQAGAYIVLLPLSRYSNPRYAWGMRQCVKAETRLREVKTALGRIVKFGPFEGEWVER